MGRRNMVDFSHWPLLHNPFSALVDQVGRPQLWSLARLRGGGHDLKVMCHLEHAGGN